MKKNRGSFLNLLKATRIKRTLPILAVILIPAAYTNKSPLYLLPLALAIILIYSASSIYNAYLDKDYKLPKYFPKVILTLIATAFLVSLTNKIIFLTALFAMFLGYIYNKFARFMTYGDTFVAGITHFVLPLLVSSLLVNLSLLKTMQLTSVVSSLALCLGPITNLKDIKKDKFLGYKTLVNEVKKPKNVSIIFLGISFIIIIFLYKTLGLNGSFLLFLIPVFLLMIIIDKKILKNDFNDALNLMRLYTISSLVILIFLLSANSYILLSSLSIFFTYLFTLINWKKEKWNIMM